MLASTKGNLLRIKSILKVCKNGYDLLDKRRVILLREKDALKGQLSILREKLSAIFKNAYESLKYANLNLGIFQVEQIACAMPMDDGISVSQKSIMGVEIPELKIKINKIAPNYSFFGTNSYLDMSYINFNAAKMLCVELAQIENSLFVLNKNIEKTTRRANSLKNITIPRLLGEFSRIQNELEEKELEELSRLKVIKNRKNN